MRVVHLSESDHVGGAAIAAHRLNRGLRALDVDSCMLVNKKISQDESVVGPESRFDKAMSRVSPYIDRLLCKFTQTGYSLISPAWVPDHLLHRVSLLGADILNLHWINNGFMRIETLRKFRKPVIWTLHDMWPFCGGEHYCGESYRYKTGYLRNNRLDGESGLDINRWVWLRKKKAWSGLNEMVIATPSKWLAACAAESALFMGSRIEVLPNGVDHERFHPIEPLLARRVLGLPANKKLILFGAGSATSDKRKGFHLLVEALNKLEASNFKIDYELVVFGASSGEAGFSAKTHYLGNLSDEISMSIVYAAADIFVAPSVEDNLPNTVLEALSCGTPVIAFNTGGMPDMISHKQNGYLASGFNTSDLCDGMVWLMKDGQKYRELSDCARKTVIDNFTLEKSANRYLDVYKSMIEGND